VPATQLVALLEARPVRPFWGRPWLEAVFEDHLPPIAPGDGVRTLGWSVGAVFGAETLVQSRPIVRGKDVDLVDDLLRANAACTIAALSIGKDDAAAPRDVVRIGRFRRWIGAMAGPSLPERLRRDMYSELPDFLSRSNGGGKTDAELMLMRVLASLHRNGVFSQAMPPAEAIRRGLAELAAMLPQDETRAMLISDGRTLGLLNRGGTLLSFAPPDALRPTARFRIDGSAPPGLPASLLMWLPSEPSVAPYAGTERIADGIVSAQASHPGDLVRD
jgi:hypothetical protein